MAIITIYQGASGSGEELADAVAQSLGCGCISREVLVEASLRYNIPEAKLNDIVEKGSNWWDRFMENLQPYRIALQADLIDHEQFAKACMLWSAQKHLPLAQILHDQGWLSPSDRADVDKIVERKLEKHSGDAHARLPSACSTRT